MEQILLESAGEGAVHGVQLTSGLKRTLSVWDLTSLGIAAVIGAGIFSTVGAAASNGGPATVFLFIFTAIACAFSAFCYAEFASGIPVAGSAYTYAYASLGELLAWIIGWDLLMEYAIGNIAVAISWGDYLNSLLSGYGIHLPTYLTTDLLSASRGYEKVKLLLDQGIPFSELLTNGATQGMLDAYTAWTTSPQLFGLHLIFHFPAVIATILVTVVVYIGIQESKRVANAMVGLKILVLLLVVGLGAFYVKPENWSPFAPNGISGVMKGVSAIFFAYIGFDAISTTAEECKNPQRDLPRAMIYSLAICTVLYVMVALVLTGVVKYDKLAVGDPLAYVFGPEGANVNWIAGIISISAVIALFTVLLVFQLGQPRIWMAMSRDGLLPGIFSAIHPKFKTPWFSTLVAGFIVGIPCMFMNLTEVTDLTSIGTLFAFAIVCAGVLAQDPKRLKVPGRFYTPYIDSRFIYPGLVLLGAFLWYRYGNESLINYLGNFDPANPGAVGFEVFKHRLPLTGFLILIVYLAAAAWWKRLSLIPLLGLTSCAYLMTELGIVNWYRFGIWLVLGLTIYFLYSRQNSKLGKSRG
ncbi:MAG: amino acid permease [Bdellovibrionales bacterium]|nr:amino acid permease [Bdellovibrionales bacterium]